MYNGNQYNGPSMVMPANYAPAPEPPQKRSHKGLILIIVAILIIGAIITVAIVVFTNDNDFHRDAEQITYDSSDEETGGGKESIPKNETIFLLGCRIKPVVTEPSATIRHTLKSVPAIRIRPATPRA